MSRAISLRDAAGVDRRVVGGKAAGLGMLIRAGFRVPDGFVIPPDVGETAVEPLLRSALGDEVGRHAYRSSAPAEDGVTASFAGQYETVLDVVGAGAGAEAVTRVRASAYAETAAAYRDRTSSGDAAMAVVVQRQIDPLVSGAAFTRDPVTGADTVVIEAVPGIGEALMSGSVTPESWTVGSVPRLAGDPDGAILTHDDAAEIARLCREIEIAMGGPQDVEWAIDDSGIWILQSRSITALPQEPTARPAPRTRWERSDAFFPEPIAPLAYTAWLPTHTRATAKAFELLGIPAGGVDHGHFWGRVYDRVTLLIGGEADDRGLPPAPIFKLVTKLHPGFRARLKTAAAAALNDLPMHFIESWEQGGRHRIRTRTRELRSVDLSSLSDRELADHLREVREHSYDCGVEHFKLVFGGWILVGQLGMLADELAGWDPDRVIDLIQGHGTATRLEGQALSALCESVASDQEARTMLEGSGDLRSHQGAAGEALRAFLDEYGHRSFGSLTQPTWAEEPQAVLALVRSCLDGDGREAPDVKTAANDAVTELLSRVSDEADRGRLASAVERAQQGRPYGDETERDPLDAMGLIHYLAMEAAMRFVESGRLGEIEDVRFLEIDELEVGLRGMPIDTDAIQRRRAEYRWAMANQAPRNVGPEAGAVPGPGLFPSSTRPIAGAFLWALQNLFYTAAFEPDSDGSLRGLGASAGIAEGTALVVRSHADFVRVQPGDVVICPSTMASWSAIFPVIGGLVTEVGGPLSHPGTLAREFGLPAVLAVTDATTLIEEGSRIRIDGARGTVAILA
jgi:phosphohistidine swiveling domain-containing protein